MGQERSIRASLACAGEVELHPRLCHVQVPLPPSRGRDLRELHASVVVDECEQLHTPPRCLSLLFWSLGQDARVGLGRGCMVLWHLLVRWRLPCSAGACSELWRAVQELRCSEVSKTCAAAQSSHHPVSVP